MGTRSLTVMYNVWRGDPVEIAVLYRQMDGYPTGHGAELKEFLSGFVVGNGLSFSDSKDKYANGADCLAAQIVAHFKTDAGGFYLHPAGTRDAGEEWVYEVYAGHKMPIRLRVMDVKWVDDSTVVPEGYRLEYIPVYDGSVEDYVPVDDPVPLSVS